MNIQEILEEIEGVGYLAHLRIFTYYILLCAKGWHIFSRKARYEIVTLSWWDSLHAHMILHAMLLGGLVEPPKPDWYRDKGQTKLISWSSELGVECRVNNPTS